jgi:hypothetical protein
VSVVAEALVGITADDADGDRCRRCCPRGAVMADVMRGARSRRRRGDGKATARRRRGDGEVTTRQQQGNKDGKAIGYDAAGGRGNEAIDNNITNNI